MSIRFVTALFIWQFSYSFLQSQTTEQALRRHIYEQDSLFWQAYNTCDHAGFRKFFTQDIEFYHDKGGITLGIDNMVASLQNNLCSNPNFRVRRAPVDSTVAVFPLSGNTGLYGAIISGDHLFFVTENGQKEYQTGQAKFMQLWLKDSDGVWRMARILSYQHMPAEPSKH